MAIEIRINQRNTSDAADTNGTWNNVAPSAATGTLPVTVIADCLDFVTGIATGIDWERTSRSGSTNNFAGASNGVNNPGSGAAAFVDEPTISDQGWTLASGAPQIENWTFGGITGSDTWALDFYGSREATGANRSTDFTIGATTQSYDADGNNTTTAGFTGLNHSSGDIAYSFQRGASNASGFNYLGAAWLRTETPVGNVTYTFNAASLNLTAQDLTWMSDYAVSLSAAALDLTPQDLDWQSDFSVALNAAVMTITGQPLQVNAEYAVAMSAAALDLQTQPVDVRADYLVGLVAGVFRMQGRALDIPSIEAVTGILAAWLRRRRR